MQLDGSTAFSGFSVKDIAAAKAFYGNTLGLRVTDADMGLAALHVAGGNPVLIYPKGEGHTPATYTVLNFKVKDIDAAIDALVANFRAGTPRQTLLGITGSGKTYALGVILERLLVHTSLPLIIIDPNSDYVHLGALLPREKVAMRGRPPMTEPVYAALGEAMAASGAVRVASAHGGDLPLRIHFSDLSLAEQALTLGLDSLRDPDEYSAFMDVVEEVPAAGNYSVDRLVDLLQRHADQWSHRLLQRIRNDLLSAVVICRTRQRKLPFGQVEVPL